jgi:outer membrane protein assembly factor BamD
VAFTAFSILMMGCGSTSPYQGMDDEQLYQMGLTKFEEGEFGDAAKALDRLLVSFGNSDRTAASRLLLGHAYYGKGDYLTSRSEYKRFLDRYAAHPDAPTAALGVCRSLVALSPQVQREQSYTMDAISLCRNVVVDYPGTEAASTAADLASQMRLKLAEKDFLNADFYFRRRLYDSAIIYFQSVVDRYPDTEWAPKALLGIYQANVAFGYDDLAEDARTQLLTNYPDSESARVVSSDGAGS